MALSEIVLKNSNGFVVKTISLGATVTSVQLPNGTQVLLGFNDLEVYRTNPPYFGCSVGRCANRIAGVKFTLDGREYKLTETMPSLHLHGGAKGFNKLEWTLENKTDTSVTYKVVSPDGDQGYPGQVTVTATYTVTDSNQLIIEYTATTDTPTIVNLTNHGYFNLAGDGRPILDHILTLNADNYTPVKEFSFPTGEIASVKGTVMDFLTPKKIGERYKQIPGSEVGYDHNFCLNSEPQLKSDSSLHLAAKLEEPTTGNSLVVHTNQLCVQLYMGGYLDGKCVGLDGKPIQQHTGLCLETQIHPDAINQENFPSPILRPGEKYYSKTVWGFSWPN